MLKIYSLLVLNLLCGTSLSALGDDLDQSKTENPIALPSALLGVD